MEHNSPEQRKPKTENPGKIVTFFKKMDLLSKDPTIKQAAIAAGRTLLNLGISAADFIPGGVGEIADGLATVAKTIQRAPGEKPDPSKFSVDLTPDVPTMAPWLSQLPEFFTGGAFPSYAIPTAMQLRHDIPLMVEGVRQARTMLKQESDDYQANEASIDKAINTFNSTNK